MILCWEDDNNNEDKDKDGMKCGRKVKKDA